MENIMNPEYIIMSAILAILFVLAMAYLAYNVMFGDKKK